MKVAYCGVYCGACPSFQISCEGCRSEAPQKRKSKWSCKIRVCCKKKKNSCYQCKEFPCKKYKKLCDSHPGDSKFEYRHELPANMRRLKKIGLSKWSKEQEKRWSCKCGGTILFYHYKCDKCGNKPKN